MRRAHRQTDPDERCCDCGARKIGQPLLSAPANEPFRRTRHRSFQCGICSCSSSSTAAGATPRSNHGKVCCFASSCSTSTFTATGTAAAAAAAASFQWPLLPAARGDGRDRITRCAAELAVSAAACTDGTSTAARSNGTSSSSCSHGRGDRGAAEEGDVAAARRAAARAHAAR